MSPTTAFDPRQRPGQRPRGISFQRKWLREILVACAEEIDADGHLHALADRYGWHRCTLWKWVQSGRVPRRKAVVLTRDFGLRVGFTVEGLTGRLK